MSGGLVSRAGASSRSRALRVAGSIALAIGLASCLAPVHRPRIRILGAGENDAIAYAIAERRAEIDGDVLTGREGEYGDDRCPHTRTRMIVA